MSSAIFFAKNVGSITKPTRTSDMARLKRSLVDGLRISDDLYNEMISRIFRTVVGRISMASSEAVTMYTLLTASILSVSKVKKRQRWDSLLGMVARALLGMVARALLGMAASCYGFTTWLHLRWMVSVWERSKEHE